MVGPVSRPRCGVVLGRCTFTFDQSFGVHPQKITDPEVQMKFIVAEERSDARGREDSRTGFWVGIVLLVFIAFKLAASLIGV